MWTGGAPAQDQALRHVPVLAQFLKPILGRKAEREAARLITKFGCIANILDTTPAALREALADRPELANSLLAARELALAGWAESIRGKPVDTSDPHLKNYLVGKLQSPREERFHAIFIDRDQRIIHDERICTGGTDGLKFRTRHVIHRSLELNAYGLIVAHNHPSGKAAPSRKDWQATDHLRSIAAAVDVSLLDHFVVASGAVYSMRLQSLI